MPDAILTLNAGSSSIKFALFELPNLDARLQGEIEGIGTAPHLLVRDRSGADLFERRWEGGDAQTHEALLEVLLDWLEQHLGEDRLIAVGHRVVHGGGAHIEPARVDAALIDDLEKLTPLAPLHQPHNLSPMRAIARLRPELAQVACFDTAFHSTMPAVATRFALPRAYAEEGVRRYGFHGLSYEYIAGDLAQSAPDLARGRTIVAHLGNGASLCALRDGKSVDTTMGFTALDGLVMGTRCGTIDPGVVIYLADRHHMAPDVLNDVLYHRSGLLGISGISADMRALEASDAEAAHEAIESFVYRIVREAGALVSVLGGLDGFVFTAGIGQHDAKVRAAVCEGLAWLGIALDAAANDAGSRTISAASSRVAVLVVPTNEELMIARHTLAVIGDE